MTGITWCSAAVLSGMNPYHSGKRRDMAFMDLHMVHGSAVALSVAGFHFRDAANRSKCMLGRMIRP